MISAGHIERFCPMIRLSMFFSMLYCFIHRHDDASFRFDLFRGVTKMILATILLTLAIWFTYIFFFRMTRRSIFLFRNSLFGLYVSVILCKQPGIWRIYCLFGKQPLVTILRFPCVFVSYPTHPVPSPSAVFPTLRGQQRNLS